MKIVNNFPSQTLSYKRKSREWRKKCMDWADNKTCLTHIPTRNSVMHKKINYDLVNGVLHMDDLAYLLNPTGTKGIMTSQKIPHYPILNSILQVLQGEELSRLFDYRVIVTNKNAISEIEQKKKEVILNELQKFVMNTNEDDEYAAQRLSDYLIYEYQDYKEILGNEILNHYVKELNIPYKFNQGFIDAEIVGEEIYLCDIVCGEPTFEKIDPNKIRIWKTSNSNRVEDADVIIIEDYWSPGKIIDTYWESLTDKDVKYLEGIEEGDNSYGYENEARNYIRVDVAEVTDDNNVVFDVFNVDGTSKLPYDLNGNVRVLRMYWKSRRKIKKVTSIDPLTGDDIVDFYPEDYEADESLGEKEETFWINEAWEGVKIGSEIYINIRPRQVQYNSISNPSKCHFGIVGTIYSINDGKPFSLVDRMKHYNYQYDVIHDRLNKLIAENWGKIITLDMAKKPKNWDVEKWIYYARVNKLAVVDSFREGNIGASTGKLAGGLNNNTSGVIDADFGNNIQQYINLLEYYNNAMGEAVGVNNQRKGQMQNRETVGGVERATLQSSYITEYIFNTHDDTKKRALQMFIDTTAIALRGKSKKFQYICSDGSLKASEVTGDLFNNCDYGIMIDNSQSMKELNNSIGMLAQAALQNDKLKFSDMMRLYGSESLAEKQRLIERSEREAEQRRQQEMQQQQQQLEMQQQTQMQIAQMQMQQQDMLNQRDNDTKIRVAEINSTAEEKRFAMMQHDGEMQMQAEIEGKKLEESKRQFDEQQRQKEKELANKQQEFLQTLAQKRAEFEEKQRSNKANEAIKRRSGSSSNSK